MATRGRLLLVLMFVGVLPATAFAEGQQWGLNIWGLSYHVDRTVGYNEDNWGLGVRYYNRPRWRWLGKDEDNRVFLEADALRNSNRGLVVPLSAGVEYEISPHSGRCKLFAVAALTLAYYRFPQLDKTEIKVGPVPGIAIGCGHLKGNLMVVLRKNREPLAALTASMTVVF
jgi:hypothetical protein